MADDAPGGAISAGAVYMDVLPRMGRFVGAVNTQLGRVATGLSTAGRGLTRGLTLPILGAGAAAFQMSRNFEKSMAMIGGLVGTNQRQLDSWKEQILDLGGKLPQGPNELAESLYYVASSGFKGEAAFKAMLASARASAAGLGDVQTVANAVTSAVSAFGPKVLSAADASDVLIATVREGKGEADELAGAIGRVIPVASNVGVSFNEVGAALASMTLTGLDSYEATTALRGIFQSFVKPAAQSRDALKDVGLSIQGVRKSIREEGLLTTLLALRDRIGGNQDALGKILPNVRALNGFLSLTGERADENKKIFKDLENNLGDTTEAMKVMSRTSDFKLKTALSNLQGTAIKFGDLIAPGIQKLVGSLSRAVKWFGNLDESTKKTIVQWAGYAAAAGPALFITGKLLNVVRLLGSGLFGLAKGIGKIGSAFGLAGAETALWTASIVGLGVAAKMTWDYLKMDDEQAVKWAASIEKGKFSIEDLRKSVGKVTGESNLADMWNGDRQTLSAYWQTLERFNKSFDRRVRSILEGTGVEKKWGKALHDSGAGTMRQRRTVATLLKTMDNYNIELSDSAEFTLEAYLRTGDYKSAIRLLHRELDPAWKGLKNMSDATAQAAEDAGDAAAKTRRYTYWLKQAGIEAKNFHPPDISITDAYNIGGARYKGAGGQTGGATGSHYWRGGPLRVGEFGPERVWLPRGSRIISASRTRLATTGGGGGGDGVIRGKLTLSGGDAYVEGVMASGSRSRARFANRRRRMYA